MMTAPYLAGDPEWNATVHCLAALEVRKPGHFLVHVDAARRSLDCDALKIEGGVLSSGERRVFDAAVAMWSGTDTRDWWAWKDTKVARAEPLLPVARLTHNLDEEFFETIIEALRIRRGASPESVVRSRIQAAVAL